MTKSFVWLPGRLAFAGAWLLAASASTTAQACPFCAAVSQTFSEEIGAMDVVVLAELKVPPGSDSSSDSKELPRAKFSVTEVIKGEPLVKKEMSIETIFLGDPKKNKTYLIMGVDPPKITWSTPMGVSDRGREYLLQLPGLPKEGADRLAFFQNHLEDADEMLARDAYDEFAKAPYADVQGLKDRMHHDRLVAWIKDQNVPASRRRLYLTMLGVCGTADDLPMLEQMLNADDRKARMGLDAMIACYLTLRGPEGMPLVEELFLKNEKAEYADTYAAIMALRFHGTETDIVPRERILEGLRHMLRRPQLADLVIPDLARWEDWSAMDQLVALFKASDEKTSWVRVPVINYMRACPLPKAKEHLQELEKLDPEAVKRANTFFPFGAGAPSKSSSTDDAERASSLSSAVLFDGESSLVGGPSLAGDTSLADDAALPATVLPTTSFTSVSVAKPPADLAAPPAVAATSPAPQTPQAARLSRGDRSGESASAARANLWLVLGVPWMTGCVLWGLLWTILRGARPPLF